MLRESGDQDESKPTRSNLLIFVLFERITYNAGAPIGSVCH
jgi:hypothetical protein